MTKEKNLEKTSSEEIQKLKQENKELKLQVQLVSDLHNLKDEAYFRQQILLVLEKLCLNIERQAIALENFSEGEKENKDSDEE